MADYLSHYNSCSYCQIFTDREFEEEYNKARGFDTKESQEVGFDWPKAKKPEKIHVK